MNNENKQVTNGRITIAIPMGMGDYWVKYILRGIAAREQNKTWYAGRLDIPSPSR